jgi:hypothetical protein
MGVRVDLIDRAVYAQQPDQSPIKERNQKINEDNNHAASGEADNNSPSLLFNERDKFLLSDKDILPMIKPKAVE